MVARSRKKPIISLSTWGIRGTAGLVEEWESRRPIPEENPKPRRRSSAPGGKSTESTTTPGDPKA